MVSSRTAAHVLSEIATLLELRGESRTRTRPYEAASRTLQGLNAEDVGPLLIEKEAGALPTMAPAAIAVLRELAETRDSETLELLRETTPEGLLEMLRVPGLGTARIHQLHEKLGIETLHELEQAARDGRLAALPRFGARTADKVLRGIANLRASGARVLHPHAAVEAARLLNTVRAHDDVGQAAVVGSLRRGCETIGDIDIVAACRRTAPDVAADFAHAPGAREVIGGGGPAVTIRYEDGTRLDLTCVPPDRFALALWWETGSAAHCDEVVTLAAREGVRIARDGMHDAAGREVAIADERDIYAAAGLPFICPELREGLGEVAAGRAGELPGLIEAGDVRGVLHCHSRYSDGGSEISELAAAARARGWEYLGVSDHSQSSFYAGGLARDAILRQHDEIDALNAATPDFRVLKGIEADILPCGRVDYDPDVLDRFDYVIASVHSRFGMNEAQMTERVLKALDDPHVTVLGHPTGRLLLTREAFAIDMETVLEKAGACGVAVELNADPHRLDLDWRQLRAAARFGAKVEIGPDAHTVAGLDHMALGVVIARKGWLRAVDVLNTRTAAEVVAFAAARRPGRAQRPPRRSHPEAVHAG
jgi:DNA polymerase (family X)